MGVRRRNAALTAAVVGIVAAGSKVGTVRSQEIHQAKDQQQVQDKISRAPSAGPDNITKDATVAEPDGHGGLTVLLQGTNAIEWNKDFAEQKPKPTTTVPGIESMLDGASERSNSDPFDNTSPPIKIGPHWMILWPFDPKTSGLPTKQKPTGAYIMWTGTSWAHVHVMGRP
jgi:hypothetical protein